MDVWWGGRLSGRKGTVACSCSHMCDNSRTDVVFTFVGAYDSPNRVRS